MLWTVVMVTGLAWADDAWTTREVELLRWPPAVMESAPKTATAAEGDKLTVVLEDGDMVRVLAGEHFGWVPADALSREAPAGAEDEAAEDAASGG